MEPTVTVMPEIKRSVAGIDQGLRDVIRKLVTGESPWPLFLHGPAGSGKTCAGLCLLDHSCGLYYTASRLCDDYALSKGGKFYYVREGHSSAVCWPQSFWGMISFAGLVVLDEIGCRDRVTDHHYEAIQGVLDNRAFKPLVCISNHDLDALGRIYDDRITSRIARGTVIELQGRDRRLRCRQSSTQNGTPRKTAAT